MKIQFYNTKTKSKEEFKPIHPEKVGMYVCGPTVYDHAHLGNARSAVIFDTLYRFLREIYLEVNYVRNITDVDDKINKAAKENGENIEALTVRTTQYFHEDMGKLGVLNPTHEPRATQHIGEMIELIQQLIENGHAYAADGHVLFDVASYKDYGHLSRRSLDEMIAGARVEIASYKKNPADFVLWKPSLEGEPAWESPWGNGRPGWHLECSAMSHKYLGENFDIHGGGMDLCFPHHENEIAQSVCAYPDSSYANYWIHNGFLTAGGEKMSKSLGNFFTVQELLEKGIKGETIRYALLSTHYRKPLDWNDKLLHDANDSMNKFYRALPNSVFTGLQKCDEVLEALADDLNTPKAMAELHALLKEINKTDDADEKEELGKKLRASGQILGVFNQFTDEWFDEKIYFSEEIHELIEKRTKAKQEKKWTEADKIRDELKAKGITLEDRKDGTTAYSRSYK